MYFMSKFSIRFQIVLLIVLAASGISFGKTLSLVSDGNMAGQGKYGLDKLQEAIELKTITVQMEGVVKEAKGEFIIVAGLAGEQGQAAKMLSDLKVTLPKEAQGLVVQKTKIDGKQAVILCGYDEAGLMYAALDTADRMSWCKDDSNEPFEFVKDTAESPLIKERSVCWYTMQRAYFESRIFDEKYLVSYFDMLAKNRFNNIMVILGYNNECYTMPLFTGPVYPYFFNVEGFEGVKYGGLSEDEQKKHVEAFKRMMEIAHERGIQFGVGLWDHVPDPGVDIKGKKLDPNNLPNDVIVGITRENLNEYTKTAFTKFLQTFPGIDSVEFRLHWESGLKKDQAGALSHVLFETVKKERPEILVQIRSKDVPEEIINDAISMGLKVRMETKYWMEQMGMPFHPTHVNPQNQHDRRHSYGDMIRYPQEYKIQFRLWNGGTNRVLVWGDPEYAKRFAESVKIYNGDSFEINDSLVLKMNGQPHDMKPFNLLNPGHEYYTYEFERYWDLYKTFGRIGYNPDCDPAIWEHEFMARFGEAGKPLMDGLGQASKVLPRIIASSFPYKLFPTPKGWAEMRTFGTLKEYSSIEGTDIEQFLSPSVAAKCIEQRGESAKRWPQQSSEWFADISRQILENIAKAEAANGERENKEFESTIADLSIYAYLAEYHSKRLKGGVEYNLFKDTGDLFALDEAIELEKQAIAAWENIIQSAGDIYNFHILIGNEKAGTKKHWREWMPELKKSLADLEKEKDRYKPKMKNDKPLFVHVPVRKLGGNELVINATAATAGKIEELTTWIAISGKNYEAITMEETGKWQYEAKMPHAEIERDIKYYIEMKADGKTYLLPEKGKANPFIVMAGDNEAPAVTHEKITSAKPNENLKFEAKVTDPSGVKWVRLKYRHLNQFEDYKTVEMKKDFWSGMYKAEIPGDFIIPKWDMMYFFEVMDKKDNGKVWPDLDKEMPYVIVPLKRN